MTATVQETHPFTRAQGAAAWICECGKSRNSSAHAGQGTTRRPRAERAVPPGHVAAAHVEPGMVVLTTDVVGEDFGLPVVEPVRRRGGFTRIVKSHLRQNGGTVVRFTDGTKTRPMHGRSVLVLAETTPEDDAS